MKWKASSPFFPFRFSVIIGSGLSTTSTVGNAAAKIAPNKACTTHLEKLLCTCRIVSELLSASPTSSGEKPVVNALKSVNVSPRFNCGQFNRMDKMACVAHASSINYKDKKRTVAHSIHTWSSDNLPMRVILLCAEEKCMPGEQRTAIPDSL